MKFKHKWRKHLFFKYRTINYIDHVEESERLRLWVLLPLILLSIIILPFVLIYFVFSLLIALIIPSKEDKTSKTKKEEAIEASIDK